MESEDQKLTRLMKDNESAYIDDSGFTARVMAALPPPQRRSAVDLRRNVLLVGACALSILLPLLISGKEFLTSVSALISLIVERPVFSLYGVALGAFPLACLLVGLLAVLSFSRKLIRL